MASSDRPDPQVIAQQLRKPSGEAAEKIGDSMDQVNEPLFDLTLDAMQLAGNERILEIGFGTGAYLDRVFANAAGLKVYGIDFSPDMLEIATRKNKDLVDAGRLELTAGASEDLPYDDGSFDKVYCNMVIYFWDIPEDHLKEVHRVLKPGGHFYTGMRTRDSMLQFPFVQFGFMLFDPGEWMRILEQNGFEARQAARRLDPVIEGEDGDIQLESVCIKAAKKENRDGGIKT